MICLLDGRALILQPFIRLSVRTLTISYLLNLSTDLIESKILRTDESKVHRDNFVLSKMSLRQVKSVCEGGTVSDLGLKPQSLTAVQFSSHLTIMKI